MGNVNAFIAALMQYLSERVSSLELDYDSLSVYVSNMCKQSRIVLEISLSIFGGTRSSNRRSVSYAEVDAISLDILVEAVVEDVLCSVIEAESLSELKGVTDVGDR